MQDLLRFNSPSTLGEALALFAGNVGAQFIAGGTDVLIDLKNSPDEFSCLISLAKINELHFIKEEEEELRIGALVTHRELQKNRLINLRYSALAQGSGSVGSAQIRNLATVGGNICSGLPSADTASPLLVLDASVRLVSSRGERILPLDGFFLSPGKTLKMQDEILTEIIVPRPPERSGSAYIKHAKRKALEIAMLGAAVYIETKEDGTCSCARIALTTASPVPMRAKKAESFLCGKPVSSEMLDEAGRIAAGEASPRTSWRCSAEYRMSVLPVLVRRAGLLALGHLDGKRV